MKEGEVNCAVGQTLLYLTKHWGTLALKPDQWIDIRECIIRPMHGALQNTICWSAFPSDPAWSFVKGGAE